LILGDSVTTDHISPAGSISKNSPAGKYLVEKGVKPEDFNSFGSRRGNHEIMMRGTYGNNRLKNQLASQEGGYTVHLPDRKEGFIFDIAQQYSSEKTPLIVFAGKEYGAGSSRDWAAKGTYLLGIKAVIAESYERIHRSNLVGMGVIPLEFEQGRGYKYLSADVTKKMTIEFTSNNSKSAVLKYINTEGKESTEKLKVRIDNDAEMLYFSRGGILQNALSNIINAGKTQ
jgi:aconitate hydratase